MESHDKETFSDLVSALFAAFGKKSTEAAFLGYEIGLQDLPLEAIRRAVFRAIRESRFLPPPAELRDLAGVLTPEQRALKSFYALANACIEVGVYKSIDFDDSLINACVRHLGGWEKACTLDKPEFEKWYRRDFLSLYQNLLQCGVGAEEAAPLVGIHERGNAFHGFDKYTRPAIRYCTGLPALPSSVPRVENRRGPVAVDLLRNIGIEERN